MFCKAMSVCGSHNLPQCNTDVRVKKSSSNWTYFTGLFKTAFDYLTKPSNYLPCLRKRTTFLDVNDNLALSDLYNRRGRFFRGSVVQCYLTAIQTTKFVVASGALHNTEKKSLSEIHENVKNEITDKTELVVIPYDNFGHHVVIIADLKNKRIEYFDPKGASCRAKESKRGRKLAKEIIDLSNKLFGTVNIIQNFTQFQTDHYTCGIWGAYYITQRLNGVAPDKIAQCQINTFYNTMIAAVERQARLNNHVIASNPDAKLESFE